MSQKYEKLKTLLRELFQLDQPDLDFGLYRIMNAKSAEVSQFLDDDLLPQVRGAFALYRSADKKVLQKSLGVALLRRRPRGLLGAAWQELLDASKAWWRGRRGRLADRRGCPRSVSLGVIPFVFARFVELPVRIEVAAGS